MIPPSIKRTLIGLNAHRYCDVLRRPSEQDKVEIAIPDVDSLRLGKRSLAHGDFHFEGRHEALYRD
jgi:hypothetical protein